MPVGIQPVGSSYRDAELLAAARLVYSQMGSGVTLREMRLIDKTARRDVKRTKRHLDAASRLLRNTLRRDDSFSHFP
jgi:hypothetical protein